MFELNSNQSVCTNLCIHTWGRRRIPALARRQTSLTFLRQTSCHKLVLSRPWFVYLHRPQPWKLQDRHKLLSVLRLRCLLRHSFTLCHYANYRKTAGEKYEWFYKITKNNAALWSTAIKVSCHWHSTTGVPVMERLIYYLIKPVFGLWMRCHL